MKLDHKKSNAESGVALPVSLIVVALILVVAVSLIRAAKSDLAVGGSEGDRVFAAQASDAALRSLVKELQLMPAVPELVDPSGATLLWWNANAAAVSGSFWSSCATAPAGARCSDENVTRADRTFRVQRMIQPNSTPDERTATSGARGFYYRAAVLVTLDNGARSEIESYVRRPQLVRN